MANYNLCLIFFLYKINIKNLLGTMQSIDIGFGKVFNEFDIKNSFLSKVTTVIKTILFGINKRL